MKRLLIDILEAYDEFIKFFIFCIPVIMAIVFVFLAVPWVLNFLSIYYDWVKSFFQGNMEDLCITCIKAI